MLSKTGNQRISGNPFKDLREGTVLCRGHGTSAPDDPPLQVRLKNTYGVFLWQSLAGTF